MTKVCLVTVTPDAEKTIGYIARVSNPNNQDNPKVEGLLKYCIKHGHWSIFEQAHMTLQIETTRGIAAQILRHRSFTFQEFSQRYADTNLLDPPVIPELRRQDTKIDRIVSMISQKPSEPFYKAELNSTSMKDKPSTMTYFLAGLQKSVRDLCSPWLLVLVSICLVL